MRANLPLQGATVVLTRPVGEAGALAAAVRRRGGRALALATVRLVAAPADTALADALAAVAGCDVAVFVSVPAVRHAFAAGLARTAVRCAVAVGAATARALARHGIDAQRPAGRADSEGVLALPVLAAARRVALVGAPGGRGLIEESLRARGVTVVRVDVYARAPCVPAATALRRLDALHVPPLVLLSSSATLAALEPALGPARWARLARGTWVVPGARIAAAARAHGIDRIVIARSALAADLLDAAARAWRAVGAKPHC